MSYSRRPLSRGSHARRQFNPLANSSAERGLCLTLSFRRFYLFRDHHPHVGSAPLSFDVSHPTGVVGLNP